MVDTVKPVCLVYNDIIYFSETSRSDCVINVLKNFLRIIDLCHVRLVLLESC